MKILQIGYPKSGNFWLYQILEKLFEMKKISSKSFIQQHPIHSVAKNWKLNFPGQADIDVIDVTDLQTTYRISSIFKMPIEEMADYVAKTNHVWTHSPVCKKTEGILAHFSKKVYIIRDPRDVLVSASKYFCSDYMLKYFPQENTDPHEYLEKNLERLSQEWVWHVWDYLRLQKKCNIHISFFEGFLNDFQKELSILLDYLELKLSAEEKIQLEKEVSFSKLKRDNPNHLKKGTSDQWIESLTEDQKERIQAMVSPLLSYLNYPQEDKKEKSHFRRVFLPEDALKIKKEIIA